MRTQILLVLAAFCMLSVTGCVSLPAERLSSTIESQELSDHVHFLAQPALKGRKPKTWESATVRKYLKERFKSYGLVPWGDAKGYEQPFGIGTNVIGVLEGSDPNLSDEIVILSAHYDHVGKTKKDTLLGACDNASGVAALLEIAEHLSLAKTKPKRSVCFASFDAEERGCVGAFAFTCRDDYNNSKVSAVVNIDLLGREFLDIIDNSMCVTGTDGYPNLQKEIITSGKKEGIKMLPFHSELIGPVGDHIAFISVERPVFFFSSGLYRDYHKATDTAEKLNYMQMHSSVLTISNTLLYLANSEEIETRKDDHFNNIGLQSTVYVLDKIIENRDVLDVNDIDLGKLEEISDDLKHSLETDISRSEQVAKERKALSKLLGSLQNYDKGLAKMGKGFIDISEFYALDPEAFTNAYREALKSFLENKLSILFGINYKYESDGEIADEDWAITQTKDGRYFLGIMCNKMDFEAKQGFFKRKSFITANCSARFDNCKGSRDEIIDFCVMRFESIDTPDTIKRPEFAPNLKKIFIKVFENLTNESCNVSLEEKLEERMKGFSSYNDWMVSLIGSNNPDLAKGAIRFSKLSSDNVTDKLLTIIQDETVRADVRERAIHKLSEQNNARVLMAISELVDDDTLTIEKDYWLEFDEEYPLAEHPHLRYFRNAMEKWYDTEGKKRTIGKVARDSLKKITKQDFGKDGPAWREWISSKFPVDIRSVKPDLTVPRMTEGKPAPGVRVRQTAAGFEETQIYHALYLPTDWQPSKKYPVIVEYAGNGNYRNKYGDVSTGKVEGSNLGYGISGGKGVIWVCMPYVDMKNKQNAITWWGDIEATVDYCRQTVKQVCEEYGGDRSAAFIAGFSRGAIGCNYIGLHDDEIASLWRGFIAYSHYDGVREWNYAGSDRASAAIRLERLRKRPQFICQELSLSDTKEYLKQVCPDGNFTFQTINYRNHNDAWALRDIGERKAVRMWFDNVLKKNSQ